jgi:histidyl-tRNA synthetase
MTNTNSSFNPVRGTQDLLPELAHSFRHILNIAYQVSENYGYQEIQTPIFEFSDVFHRTLGETTDMVSKETYTFLDRGGDSITLRPEGTAGVARAFISNGLQQHLPLKLFYSGPMFRYERPQKGRYRQFHQLGVECLGIESPSADVESIALAYQILNELGLQGKFQLELNTLGDAESRAAHRQALVDFLTPRSNELSPDSQIRLVKNPLRILDSKDANDQKILQGAPSLKDTLNDSSKKFFDQIIIGLDQLKIPYQLNSNLVRGIDYYTHTVFEFTTNLLGAQSAILSGGRYDGLIEQMGGPKTPGVGWASGIERLTMLIENLPVARPVDIAVLPADETSLLICQEMAFKFRQNHLKTELILSGNMGKKMKKAAKLNSKFAVIIGESEVQQKSVTIKNMITSDQKIMTWEQIDQHLKSAPKLIPF